MVRQPASHAVLPQELAAQYRQSGARAAACASHCHPDRPFQAVAVYKFGAAMLCLA
jgi:hypothetical protein